MVNMKEASSLEVGWRMPAWHAQTLTASPSPAGKTHEGFRGSAALNDERTGTSRIAVQSLPWMIVTGLRGLPPGLVLG